MSDETLDPFFYARDHAAGPGMWCVRGPNKFEMPMPDKNIAYMVGKLLSGKTDDAAIMARDIANLARLREIKVSRSSLSCVRLSPS